jgi:hypothetical protein
MTLATAPTPVRAHPSITRRHAGQTLLLTATITPPPDAVKLARTDPAARLNDYLQALAFYLNLPDNAIDRIIFVENSNSDISKLRALAAQFPNKEVEFISFNGLDYPTKYGRAFGEARLMDYAFANSEIIAELDDEARIWKGTGRLRLTNFPAMIRRAPDDYELYCDLRNVNAQWMDQRFYSFTPSGYRTILQNIADDLREDRHNTLAAETLMYRIVVQHVAPGRAVPRFRTQPFISGISGFGNYDYGRGVKNCLKDYTKVISRKLRPNYWI